MLLRDQERINFNHFRANFKLVRQIRLPCLYNVGAN